MASKPIYLNFVDKGIANRFDYGSWEEIEVHKHLLKYPKLYEGLLKHEFSHQEGNHKLADLMLDIKYDGIPKPGFYKFLFKTPGAWWQLSPVWIRNKTIIWDVSSLFMWLVFLLGCLIIGIGIKEVLI